MQPLSTNLIIIFGTGLITSWINNVVVPKMQGDMKRKAESMGPDGQLLKLTPPEDDYVLMDYNIMLEGINNFADTALQFGFSCLFVTAFPVAPLFALLSNHAKMKGIAWKLTKLYQRPIPLGAQDIGTWLPIFQFIATAAVVTNAGLVCFTMNSLSSFTPQGRAWSVIIFCGFHGAVSDYLLYYIFFMQGFLGLSVGFDRHSIHYSSYYS
jgi:hypothetical protein